MAKKTKAKAKPTRAVCVWRQAKGQTSARFIQLLDTRDFQLIAYLESGEDSLWYLTRLDTGWRSPKGLPLARAKEAALALLAGPDRPVGASAAARTEATVVSSPTVPGAVETPHRVISTIDLMARSHQLSEDEARAAEIYRHAYETAAGAGLSVDLDRPCGGIPGGPQAAPEAMLASERLRQACNKLYRKHYLVVALVVGQGHSLEECARLLVNDLQFDQSVKDDWRRITSPAGRKREVGRRLREALSELAELWVTSSRSSRKDSGRITGYAPEERGVSTAPTVVQAKYVHATARRIFRK